MPELKDPIFKCADCGCTLLEEVMSDCYVSSEIEDIDEDGDIQYGDQSTDYGLVDRYQCSRCGKVLQKDGGNIVNPETLFQFLWEAQQC